MSQHISQKDLQTKKKRGTIFSGLVCVGFNVTDAALFCVSESWALSDVLFLRLPRKSEIATGWRDIEGTREEGVRGQREEGRKGRVGW